MVCVCDVCDTSTHAVSTCCVCMLSTYAVGVCCVFCRIVCLLFIAGVCAVSAEERMELAGVGDIS